MKKFLSLLIAIMAIFSANAATDDSVERGAYAYDLTLTDNGDKYTFSFKSTYTANNAAIVLTNKSTGATNTYNIGGVKKGSNNFSLSKNGLLEGKYSWAVSIDNKAIDSNSLEPYYSYGSTPDATLGNRGGVAIDLDPESKNYGYVYVSRAKEGGGILRYTPDLSLIDGNFILADKFNAAATSSPYRIKSNSGKLYITDYSDSEKSGIFVYNPVNGSFSQMLQGTRASSGQITNNGTVVGGSITSIAFYGEGATRKMFAQCEDYYGKNQWELLRYDLGTSDTWNKAPSKTYPDITATLNKHNVEIFTCEKGVWLCQNTYNVKDDASSPTFIFMDFDGNVKFKSSSLSGNGAIDYAFESGIAINKDMTRLAVAGGGNNINFCNVKLYKVKWNEETNTPSLTYESEINLNHTTYNGAVEQIVFDPADNLLLFSRQKGLMAYAIKNEARKTVTDAPSSQEITGTGNISFGQITEGEGDEKKYSFDLKFDINLTGDINYPSTNTYIISAIGNNASDIAKELGLAVDHNRYMCIDANGNNVSAEVTKHENGIAINNNGETVEINSYCIKVKFPNVTSAKLPSFILKNVDPQLKYDLGFYVAGDNSCKLITTFSEEMTIPLPSLSLPEITFHKLNGDYSSLTSSPALQPLGSHRLINSDGTHALSNQVTINNVNYFGTNGGAITPIRVTDNIIGTKDETGKYVNYDWIIVYTFVAKKGETEILQAQFYGQENSPEYSACYSNEKNVNCDLLFLPFDYDEVVAEDGRIRKIYKASSQEYETKLTIRYERCGDDLKFEKEIKQNIKTSTSQLPSLGVSASSQEVRGSLFVPKISSTQTESHYWWNGEMGDNAQEGYYSKYYDALLLFEWNDDSDLNRYMGYYAQTDDICYGHYEDASSSTWTRYAPASVLTNSQVDEYLSKVPELTGGKIGYDGTNNWSALAVNNKQLPMRVHYVHADNGNSTIKNTDIKFNVTLTAEYPVMVSSSNSSFFIAEDPSKYKSSNLDSKYIEVLTVPTTLSGVYVSNPNVTTGVEDVEIEGVNTPVEYYNLQGVKVDNPSNGIFIKVEGDKATKVLVK